MQIMTKREFQTLIEKRQCGGIVFTELDKYRTGDRLMVTDGCFGATCVKPEGGRVIDWDWNIRDASDDDLFAIYDNNDILLMIQTLTKCLEFDLLSES